MTFLQREHLQGLLGRAEKPPGYVLPDGVRLGALQRARVRGVPLPRAFVEWLELSNGPLVGPGGFYGLEPETPWLDLEEQFARRPEWRAHGWVPVASDGTGNEYVLMPRGDDGPVAFFEMIRSAQVPEYVVSSDLNHFLIGILERELGAGWWPFDADRMFAFDPGLELVRPATLAVDGLRPRWG